MKDLLLDFGLPVLIIMVCLVLLLSGIDGEVKTMLTIATGWVFRSSWQKVKK